MNLSRLLRERVNRPLLGRGRFNLTFDAGGGVHHLTQTVDPLHYSDGGELVDIDTTWMADGTGLKIAAAGFQARASLSLQAPEVVRLEALAQPLSFRPLPLYYANALSDPLSPTTMQRLAAPQAVQATVDDDLLTWAGAYGPGTVLEWRATPTGVQKWLTIDSAARFPQPLIAGPRALLMGFAVVMPGLRAAVRGGLLDIANLELGGEDVLLRTDDEQPVFTLQRPLAFDSAGATLEGKLRFRQVGSALVIAASFPLAWFASPERQYPVRIDPTVTQEHTDPANHISAKANSTTTSTGLLTGTANSTNIDWQLFIRWPGFAVPKGSIIDAASMDANVASYSGTPGATVEAQCEDSDSAAAITSASDFYGRPRTVAGSPFSPGSTTGRKTFGDFKAAVQAVVNRPGWVSGAALGMFQRDVTRDNATVNRFGLVGPGGAAGERPVLSVDYIEQPTVANGEILVNFRTRAGGDDGFTFDDGAGGTPFNTGDTFLLINDVSSTRFDGRSWSLLTADAGKSVPAKAKLKYARLRLTKKQGASGPAKYRLTFANADSPTNPTSKSDFDGRTKLTPRDFTPANNWDAEEVETIDMTALAQAIVDRATFGGTKLLLFMLHGVGGWGGTNDNYQPHSHESSPTKAAWLELVYYDPSPPVIGGEVTLI